MKLDVTFFFITIIHALIIYTCAMGNYISPCGTLQKTRCSAGLNCKTDADCSSLNCSNGKCLAKTVLKSQIPTLGPFKASRITYYGDGFKNIQADPPPLGPQNGGWYGSCYSVFNEKPIVIPKNFDKFAALNRIQYDSMKNVNVCNRCVQLNYKGRTTIVQIVDKCPVCPVNSLDISHAAFADLVGSYDLATRIGVISNVTWQAVDCSLLSSNTVFHGSSYVPRIQNYLPTLGS